MNERHDGARSIPRRAIRFLAAAAVGWTLAAPPTAASSLHFTRVTAQAQLDISHHTVGIELKEVHWAFAGLAVADVDRDGWLDLFVTTSNHDADRLLLNQGDGTFEDVTAANGLPLDQRLSSGPLFFDSDHDGWPDLLVGGIEGAGVRLYRNRGDGTFEDRTKESGLTARWNTFAAAYGDLDADGDWDLVFSHWSSEPGTDDSRIWINDGQGSFTPLSDSAAGIDTYGKADFTFTPNIVDLDDDLLPDLAIAGDFGTSQIFRNLGGLRFEPITDSAVIDDENGMGAVVQDFDGDGDVDWFVSSIWDPDGDPTPGQWGISGNRYYDNVGNGSFVERTDDAAVRVGFWGWGACAVDFDLDGDTDIFHTNGWPAADAPEYNHDPDRLFLNDGTGRFVEAAQHTGLGATGQGRAVVCFDYDRDGDLDIAVAQNEGPLELYRNDLLPDGIERVVVLRPELSPGVPAMGSRITAISGPNDRGGRVLSYRLHSHNTYVAHQPVEVHLAVLDGGALPEVEIVFPDGRSRVLRDVPASPVPVVVGPTTVVAVPIGGPGLGILVLLLTVVALHRLRP